MRSQGGGHNSPLFCLLPYFSASNVSIVTLLICVLLTAAGVAGTIGTFSRRPVAATLCGVAVLALLGGCLSVAALGTPLGQELRWWVTISAIASATVGGGPVVQATLQLALRKDPAPAGEALPATVWIGMIERFGFIVALLLGLPEVAAILLGIKALGQYTSSSNHVPAMRILGTLTSISWALICFAVVAIGFPQ